MNSETSAEDDAASDAEFQVGVLRSRTDSLADMFRQSGLDSIIGPMRDAGASQAELDAVTRRARKFYLHRKRREAEAAVSLGASTSTEMAKGSEAPSASSGPPEPERASQRFVGCAKAPQSSCSDAGLVSHPHRSNAGSVLSPELASTAMASHSEVTHIASAQADDEPPYPISFDEIAEMIASGKPIPGIREIPDTLNEEQPTEAKVAKLAGAGRKPWEREAPSTSDTMAATEDIHERASALSI